DVLRNEWKFEGVTISDYDSLHQVIAHGVCESDYEAAKRGIDAGLDIEMASNCYVKHAKKLLEQKEIDENQIDEAVYRILKLKDELGLFDDPFKGANIEKEKELVRHPSHLKLAKEIATECAVLLKNLDVLPLNKQLKIALVGPYATSTYTNGSWSWHGNNTLNPSLESALKAQGVKVNFVCHDVTPDSLSEHELSKLKDVDLILCAIGEGMHDSGEARSKSILNIPNHQNKWIELSKQLNKKVVTILYHGRPLILDEIDSSDAILDVWFLGSQANEAIAELLIGKANPSGKLTMSYPRNEGQIPIYYNHLSTGRPKIEGVHNEFVSYYLDVSNTPKYPFGYGLSYSSFKYIDLVLSKSTIKPHETLTANVTIKNDSDTAGYEIIQLYIKDHFAQIARPIMELKQFKKVWFEPHEVKNIVFDMTLDDLMYINNENKKVYECGTFSIMIGTHSRAYLEKTFSLMKEDSR
ncbi:MAG: glycoside hydrolase family 3 C-terminal domain-containing protein, partial [Acholeplasmataceae bacterium]|nr:glycoside hydrolase family 3 C-terminal domain-containing protein [Acholeplasmataceae bacterium]